MLKKIKFSTRPIDTILIVSDVLASIVILVNIGHPTIAALTACCCCFSHGERFLF